MKDIWILLFLTASFYLKKNLYNFIVNFQLSKKKRTENYALSDEL